MLNRASPLRVEINPWTLDHTLTEAMQLQGAYVAAMETILTELATRAQNTKAMREYMVALRLVARIC